MKDAPSAQSSTATTKEITIEGVHVPPKPKKPGEEGELNNLGVQGELS